MWQRLTKRVWVLGIAGAAALFGCKAMGMGGGKTTPMIGSGAVPAAQGTVTASSTDNANTAIEVKVKHLAEPSVVAQGATSYVVWVDPEGEGSPQNLGALTVDDDLNGSLETVTPLHRFDIFVTAEPSPMTQTPSNDRLFTASVR